MESRKPTWVYRQASHVPAERAGAPWAVSSPSWSLPMVRISWVGDEYGTGQSLKTCWGIGRIPGELLWRYGVRIQPRGTRDEKKIYKISRNWLVVCLHEILTTDNICRRQKQMKISGNTSNLVRSGTRAESPDSQGVLTSAGAAVEGLGGGEPGGAPDASKSIRR